MVIRAGKSKGKQRCARECVSVSVARAADGLEEECYGVGRMCWKICMHVYLPICVRCLMRAACSKGMRSRLFISRVNVLFFVAIVIPFINGKCIIHPSSS